MAPKVGFEPGMHDFESRKDWSLDQMGELPVVCLTSTTQNLMPLYKWEDLTGHRPLHIRRATENQDVIINLA